jgi:hypothetical protein
MYQKDFLSRNVEKQLLDGLNKIYQPRPGEIWHVKL